MSEDDERPYLRDSRILAIKRGIKLKQEPQEESEEQQWPDDLEATQLLGVPRKIQQPVVVQMPQKIPELQMPRTPQEPAIKARRELSPEEVAENQVKEDARKKFLKDNKYESSKVAKDLTREKEWIEKINKPIGGVDELLVKELNKAKAKNKSEAKASLEKDSYQTRKEEIKKIKQQRNQIKNALDGEEQKMREAWKGTAKGQPSAQEHHYNDLNRQAKIDLKLIKEDLKTLNPSLLREVKEIGKELKKKVSEKIDSIKENIDERKQKAAQKRKSDKKHMGIPN